MGTVFTCHRLRVVALGLFFAAWYGADGRDIFPSESATAETFRPSPSFDTGDVRETAPRPVQDAPKARGARLPAEFEHQEALLLSCRDLVQTNPDLFVDIVRHTAGCTTIIALVCGLDEYRTARSLLQDRRLPATHLRFVEIPHDTMWTRDFGPMILEDQNGVPLVMDARYDRTRSDDDRVPAELARLFRVPRIDFPWVIEGGNLLSNGDGLGVMSNQVHDDTVVTAPDQDRLIQSIQRDYGLDQLVLLEALEGEPTGHVDMFATFVAVDTVLVGSYAREYDPENAALLDRNAALLAGIETSRGPLRVVRIPMPPHHHGVWRTYTNVVYVNGTVLVPIYPELDVLGRKRALETYASLLPGWRVVTIDASQVIESSGALHCVTMNLGPLDPRSAFPEMRPSTPLVASRHRIAPRHRLFSRGSWEPFSRRDSRAPATGRLWDADSGR